MARTPAPAVSPAFTELLPETEAKKPVKRFVVWKGFEALRVRTASGRPVLGVMECVVGKAVTRYVVSELAAGPGFPGRAFRLAKPAGEPGTDSEAESYDVLVGPAPHDRRCECKGFLRHGRCKHLDSLLALLDNRKLPEPLPEPAECPANPEADDGPTEYQDYEF